jgi:hypothetical protein
LPEHFDQARNIPLLDAVRLAMSWSAPERLGAFASDVFRRQADVLQCGVVKRIEIEALPMTLQTTAREGCQGSQDDAELAAETARAKRLGEILGSHAGFSFDAPT